MMAIKLSSQVLTITTWAVASQHNTAGGRGAKKFQMGHLFLKFEVKNRRKRAEEAKT